MEPVFALMLLKKLVAEDKFLLVKRRAKHASPITRELAKVIVAHLSIADFVKKDIDYAFPKEFVWIYKTSFGISYYIKFKFKNNNHLVLFISFHEALY